MKFLIAFAFVAMASAVNIVPVQLPEPAVPRYEVHDISPLMVPVEVMEEVRRAELSGVPLDISYAVNFVDAPEGLAVHFVDVASNVEAVNAEEEVQAPQEVVPFNAKDMVVKFVDSPINEEAQDYAVKVVEAPLPVDEQTIQRESVIVVQEPMIDQPRLPGKQFNDPRLRGF